MTPATATHISVVSGDGQEADPDDLLDDPVQFAVADANNRPMANVSVTLSVPIGGGSVPAPVLSTDAQGMVTTTWTMGDAGGQQTLLASVNAALSVTAHATTCQGEECYPSEALSNSIGDAELLTLATYDSSGQTVHPDVVRGHGHAPGFWLAITPYPGGQSQYENPSIYHSTDTRTWTVPPGVVNPLNYPTIGYNSDPDIVVNSDRRLWLYFRSVVSAQNVIRVMRSSDGVSWDSAVQVAAVPNHMLVSPSVVRGAPDAPWQMWSVNAGTTGCSAPTTTVERRTSTDGLTWSAPQTVSLAQPGRAVWHIDVEWIAARQEYWAVYNTYAIGTSCTTDALYLARSPDGVNWTVYPSPIASAGITPAFHDIVYRSTFMTDPHATQVTLWISGASYSTATGYTWQTAKVSITVDNLLAIASTPASSMRMQPGHRNLPPPEPDVGP